MSAVAYPANCREIVEDLSNNELIKRLKTLSKSLQETKQMESNEKFVKFQGLADHLCRKELREHESKEVQLLIGCCVSDLFRIFAPDSPVSPLILSDVMRFINKQLVGLGKPGSYTYARSYYLLEIVASVKMFVLCNELEDGSEIVAQLFSTLFRAYDDSKMDSILPIALQLMTDIIGECESGLSEFQPILESLLFQLVEPQKSQCPLAFQLARDVIVRSSQRLEELLQGYLDNQLLAAVPEVDDDLADDEHVGGGDGNKLTGSPLDVLPELYDISPSLVQSVFPQIQIRLACDKFAERQKATTVVLRLVEQGRDDFVQKNPALWQTLLKRFHDVNIELRLVMVKASRKLVPVLDNHRDEVLNQLKVRCLDMDESVRKQVISTVVSLASRSLAWVSDELLQEIGTRALDRKSAVRHEALVGLSLLYHRYCIQGASSSASNDEPASSAATTAQPEVITRLRWIPQRVLNTYGLPNTDDRILVEGLFLKYLVPYGLEPNKKVHHLLALYCSLDASSVPLVRRMLRVSHSIRGALISMLNQVESNAKEKTPNEKYLTAILRQLANLSQPSSSTQIHFKHLSTYVEKVVKVRQDYRRNLRLFCAISDPSSDKVVTVSKAKETISQLAVRKEIGEVAHRNTVQPILERIAPLLVDQKVAAAFMRVVSELLFSARSSSDRLPTAFQKDSRFSTAAQTRQRCSDLLSLLCEFYGRQFYTTKSMRLFYEMLDKRGEFSNRHVEVVWLLKSLFFVLQSSKMVQPVDQSEDADSNSDDEDASRSKAAAKARRSKAASKLSQFVPRVKKEVLSEMLEEFYGIFSDDNPEPLSDLVAKRVKHSCFCFLRLVNMFENRVDVDQVYADVVNSLTVPRKKSVGAELNRFASGVVQLRAFAKAEMELVKPDAERTLNVCCTDLKSPAVVGQMLKLGTDLITHSLLANDKPPESSSADGRLRSKLASKMLERLGEVASNSKLDGSLRSTALCCSLRLFAKVFVVRNCLKPSHLQVMASCLQDESFERYGFLEKLAKLSSLPSTLDPLFLAYFAFAPGMPRDRLKAAKLLYSRVVENRWQFTSRADFPMTLRFKFAPEQSVVHAVHLLSKQSWFDDNGDLTQLRRLGHQLAFVIDPLLTAGEARGYSPLLKSLEMIKRSKDKWTINDDDEEQLLAQTKLYTVCDLAIHLMLEKAPRQQPTETPVNLLELPDLLYTKPVGQLKETSYLPIGFSMKAAAASASITSAHSSAHATTTTFHSDDDSSADNVDVTGPTRRRRASSLSLPSSPMTSRSPVRQWPAGSASPTGQPPPATASPPATGSPNEPASRSPTNRSRVVIRPADDQEDVEEKVDDVGGSSPVGRSSPVVGRRRSARQRTAVSSRSPPSEASPSPRRRKAAKKAAVESKEEDRSEEDDSVADKRSNWPTDAETPPAIQPSTPSAERGFDEKKSPFLHRVSWSSANRAQMFFQNRRSIPKSGPKPKAFVTSTPSGPGPSVGSTIATSTPQAASLTKSGGLDILSSSAGPSPIRKMNRPSTSTQPTETNLRESKRPTEQSAKRRLALDKAALAKQKAAKAALRKARNTTNTTGVSVAGVRARKRSTVPKNDPLSIYNLIDESPSKADVIPAGARVKARQAKAKSWPKKAKTTARPAAGAKKPAARGRPKGSQPAVQTATQSPTAAKKRRGRPPKKASQPTSCDDGQPVGRRPTNRSAAVPSGSSATTAKPKSAPAKRGRPRVLEPVLSDSDTEEGQTTSSAGKPSQVEAISSRKRRRARVFEPSNVDDEDDEEDNSAAAPSTASKRRKTTETVDSSSAGRRPTRRLRGK